MKDATIKIDSYSPEWPKAFAIEAEKLRDVLAPWLTGTIEHIGSTAVPGLAAKPVIDIMAPVNSIAEAATTIEILSALEYCFFPYRPEEMLWFCKPSTAHRTHHLHLVPAESILWVQRITFRDALRNDKLLAREYEQLKRELATVYKHDREAYTQGKSSFVQAVLNKVNAGAA